MVILKCDRCNRETEVGQLSSLFDFRNEMVKLPEGWFEWGDGLYCPRHRLVEVPATEKVEDRP